MTPIAGNHLPPLVRPIVDDCCMFQVDANPGTPWLYNELSQEVNQLKRLHPVTSLAAAKTSGLDATQHCQLLLLQAEAHQYLAGDADSKDRSAVSLASDAVPTAVSVGQRPTACCVHTTLLPMRTVQLLHLPAVLSLNLPVLPPADKLESIWCVCTLCLCACACDAEIVWLTCRAGQLRAALHMYQQAAGVQPEEEGKQEGTCCAEAVAEASLKLAFLCNDLLQVGDAHPGMQSRVGTL